MAYKALYREFRPRTFGELKGQEGISKVLKNQVQEQKHSHAYLFAGPRGTGKTSTAKILASALNCLSPKNGEPCLMCENCLAALQDNMPDIVEMDAASNNGVDDARDIREKINLLPVKGKYKVYIIDEVHMLTGSAFNALLKTLEEPPEYAVFILATTELRKLPKTILSRCQRFDFKPVEREEMIERMHEVLSKIGKTAEEEALKEIADAADGGMRDALNILDKCVSIEAHVTEKTVSSVLNLADRGAVEKLILELSQYEEKKALETLFCILDSGIEPEVLVSQLLDKLSKMLVDTVTGKQEHSREWLLHSIDKLAETENHMKFSARPTILLEATMMRLLLPEGEETTEALKLRIEKLEQRMSKAPVVSAKPEQTTPKKKATEKKILQEPPKEMKALWSEVQKRVREEDLGIFAQMREIYPIAIDGHTLMLTGENGVRLKLFWESSAKTVVETALQTVTGINYRLEIEYPKEDDAGIAEDVEIID